jgi:hypothetical protein
VIAPLTITPLLVADLLAEGERMPVYVHVIDHPDARVLVDTGMTELHPAVADLDPRRRPLSEQGYINQVPLRDLRDPTTPRRGSTRTGAPRRPSCSKCASGGVRISAAQSSAVGIFMPSRRHSYAKWSTVSSKGRPDELERRHLAKQSTRATPRRALAARAGTRNHSRPRRRR